MNNREIIIIAGPTASGKSQAALTLSKEKPSVIINADSMQVYKEIPILSAQPAVAEKTAAKHSLYGFLGADEEFSAAAWLKLAAEEIDKAHEGGERPIIVGGTGMYLKSLMEGLAEIPQIPPEVKNNAREMLKEKGKEKFHEYLSLIDPEAGAKIRPGDSQRMLRAAEVFLETGRSILYWQGRTTPLYPKEWFKISMIMPQRAELYRKCDARFLKMLEEGALEEVKNLQKMVLPPSSTAMKALGVRELGLYIEGEITLQEAIARAQKSTRNYAKRQYTWFRHQL